MSLFHDFFGGRPSASRARRAELRGDLARAVELWAEAGHPDEAARLMILRGDAEPDARVRLAHYTQATATATPDGELRRTARVKKASLTLLLAGDGPVSEVARQDLLDAAKELESLGEAEKAASAYALVRDIEGEARALTQAGEVDKLETLLSHEHDKEKSERRRRQAHAEIEALVTSGRRREALSLTELLASRAPLDAAASDRALSLRHRRPGGPIARVRLLGKPVRVVWGDEVVVGRAEGALLVRSAALSRRHAAIARIGGAVVLRDLGSRNGTLLRGMRIADRVEVGTGVEVQLGGEVALSISPSAAFQGALDVRLAGESYVAPLGPLLLGIGAWRLERGTDGWIELATDDSPTAYLGAFALSARTTLLSGDVLASTRSGETALEVLEVDPP